MGNVHQNELTAPWHAALASAPVFGEPEMMVEARLTGGRREKDRRV